MQCPFCQTLNEGAGARCTGCGELLTDLLAPGQLLGGKYEIRRFVARGGMGIVYEAYDRLLEEAVAVKVIRPELAAGAKMAERFRREIKLARKVSDPKVCRIHEYAEDQGRRYITMEWVPGTDLKHIIAERGHLPASEAFDIADQMLDGLAAIHKAGVIHRDLKSSNLMLTGDGVVKVTDFGLAHELEADPSTTLVGSPEYMPPEQIRGEPLGFGADLYAVGVILYELFAGRVPFQADNLHALLKQHLYDPPPLEGPAAASIPEPVRRVIGRALEKHPRDRQQSVGELKAELSSARARFDSAWAVRTQTLPERRRRRRLAVAAWAGAVTLVAAGVVVLLVNEDAGPESPPAPSSAAMPPRAAAIAPPATVALALPSPSGSAPTSPRPLRSPRVGATPVDTSTPLAETTLPRAAPSPTAPPPTTAAVTAPPAPPAAAPAQGGALDVIVTPAAEVIVDGVSRGVHSRLRVPLSAGRHRVQIAHPDYVARQKIFEIIVPGQTETWYANLDEDFVRKRK